MHTLAAAQKKTPIYYFPWVSIIDRWCINIWAFGSLNIFKDKKRVEISCQRQFVSNLNIESWPKLSLDWRAPTLFDRNASSLWWAPSDSFQWLAHTSCSTSQVRTWKDCFFFTSVPLTANTKIQHLMNIITLVPFSHFRNLISNLPATSWNCFKLTILINILITLIIAILQDCLFYFTFNYLTLSVEIFWYGCAILCNWNSHHFFWNHWIFFSFFVAFGFLLACCSYPHIFVFEVLISISRAVSNDLFCFHITFYQHGKSQLHMWIEHSGSTLC